MAVIAMTREMGTLGKEVVAGLAERLGLEVIQHGLVEHNIAENAGLPENEVHRFLEGEASLFERWRMDRRRMRCCTEQEIFELAAKGNVLIRGWGSVYLLRSVPHVLSVRVCAPMEFREAVVMQRLGLKDRAAARREIERDDAAHNGAMRGMFGIDWTDPAHYTIVLNNPCSGTGMRRLDRSLGSITGLCRDRGIQSGVDEPADLRPRSFCSSEAFWQRSIRLM